MAPAALPLAFSDFFQPGAGLVLTSKVREASGREVKLVGFMARMEIPSPKAFYLASRPVACDEAGGGTADLTLDAVRVHVPWSPTANIPYLPGPLEVVGTFEVGPREDEDGRVSQFRLTVAAPAKASFADRSSTTSTSSQSNAPVAPNSDPRIPH